MARSFNSNFTARSFEEYMQPLIMLNAAQEQQEAKLDAMEDQVKALRNLKNSARDAKEYAEFQKYENELNKAADTLMTQGVLGGQSRLQLRNLSKMYRNDVNPMVDALARRTAMEEEYRKLGLSTKGLMSERDPFKTSLGEFMKNTSWNYGKITSEADIKAAASEKYAAMAREIRKFEKDPNASLDKFQNYFKTQYGYTMEEVQEAINSGDDNNLIRQIAKDTVKGLGLESWEGVTDASGNLTERGTELMDQAMRAALQGAVSAVGQQQGQVLDDKYAIQKDSQAFQASESAKAFQRQMALQQDAQQHELLMAGIKAATSGSGGSGGSSSGYSDNGFPTLPGADGKTAKQRIDEAVASGDPVALFNALSGGTDVSNRINNSGLPYNENGQRKPTAAGTGSKGGHQPNTFGSGFYSRLDDRGARHAKDMRKVLGINYYKADGTPVFNQVYDKKMKKWLKVVPLAEIVGFSDARTLNTWRGKEGESGYDYLKTKYTNKDNVPVVSIYNSDGSIASVDNIMGQITANSAYRNSPETLKDMRKQVISWRNKVLNTANADNKSNFNEIKGVVKSNWNNMPKTESGKGRKWDANTLGMMYDDRNRDAYNHASASGDRKFTMQDLDLDSATKGIMKNHHVQAMQKFDGTFTNTNGSVGPKKPGKSGEISKEAKEALNNGNYYVTVKGDKNLQNAGYMYTINTKKGQEYYFVPIGDLSSVGEKQYFQDYANKANKYEKAENWMRNYINSTKFPANYDDGLKAAQAAIEYKKRVDKNFDVNDYFKYEENETTVLASSVIGGYSEKQVSKVKAGDE
jgi:hypothetical protein